MSLKTCHGDWGKPGHKEVVFEAVEGEHCPLCDLLLKQDVDTILVNELRAKNIVLEYNIKKLKEVIYAP